MTMNITRTKNKGRKEREGKEEKNDWKIRERYSDQKKKRNQQKTASDLN